MRGREGGWEEGKENGTGGQKRRVSQPTTTTTTTTTMRGHSQITRGGEGIPRRAME